MELFETIAARGEKIFYGPARVSAIDTSTAPDTYTANAGTKVFRVNVLDDGETIVEGDSILILKIGRIAYGLGKLRNS